VSIVVIPGEHRIEDAVRVKGIQVFKLKLGLLHDVMIAGLVSLPDLDSLPVREFHSHTPGMTMMR